MFQDWLDNTEYDVIVLGTGFEESLLAGALARAGKKVLHLDSNEYYGGNTGTFPLNALEKVLKNESISNFSYPSNENSENKTTEKTLEIPKNTTPLKISTLAPPTFKNVYISWSINSHKVETKPTIVHTPKEKETSETEQSTTQITKEEQSGSQNTNTNTITNEPSTPQPQSKLNSKTEDENPDSHNTNANTNEPNTNIETKTETTPTQSPPHSEPPQIDANTKHENEIQALCKQARFFNIDLNPRLLLSIGKMVTTLISSSVGRYLEFKSVEKTYLFIGGEIQPVPSNKGDVFKSKAISLLERRSLMKFMQLIQEGQSTSESYSSFLQFVQSQGLSPTLQSFVLYAIALAVTDQNVAQGKEILSYSEGIETIQTYLGSLLKYGTTPFIASIYGTSEIPQAFCRLSAVYGGLYILRRSAQSVLIDNESQSVSGIVCSHGQVLHCKYFVAGPTYLSPLLNNNNNNNNNKSPEVNVGTARLICVTDRSIVNSEGIIFLVVPPQTPNVSNLHAIHIIQTDSTLMTTPDNKFLLHLTTIATPNSREILENAAKNFVHFNFGESQSSEKPQVLWFTYFEMHTKEVSGKENLPKNLILCGEDVIGPFVDFKKQIENVRVLFKQICPEDEFLQKVPDPEDVVWVTEGENKEEEGVLEEKKEEGGTQGEEKKEEVEVEEKKEETPKEREQGQEHHTTETSSE